MAGSAPNALHDAIYLLCKRARRILLTTFAAGVAGFLYASASGPIYTATGRVLVASTQPGQDHGEAARNEA